MWSWLFTPFIWLVNIPFVFQNIPAPLGGYLHSPSGTLGVAVFIGCLFSQPDCLERNRSSRIKTFITVAKLRVVQPLVPATLFH